MTELIAFVVGLAAATAIILLIARYKPKWLAKLTSEEKDALGI